MTCSKWTAALTAPQTPNELLGRNYSKATFAVAWKGFLRGALLTLRHEASVPELEVGVSEVGQRRKGRPRNDICWRVHQVPVATWHLQDCSSYVRSESNVSAPSKSFE